MNMHRYTSKTSVRNNFHLGDTIRSKRIFLHMLMELSLSWYNKARTLLHSIKEACLHADPYRPHGGVGYYSKIPYYRNY